MKTSLIALLGMLLAAATGCGGEDSVDDFCARITEAGCSIAGGDESACVERIDRIAAKAEEAGCRAEFDRYLDCSAEAIGSSECNGEATEERCATEGQALQACENRQ